MDEQRLDKAKADGSNPFSSTNLFECLKYSFLVNGFTIPKNTKNITTDKLLTFFAEGGSSHGGCLGYSPAGWLKFIKKVFPNKPKDIKYKSYLLSLINMKHCTKCNKVYYTDNYHSNITRYDGLSVQCKQCDRVTHRNYMPRIQSYRRASIILRSPKWADLNKIADIYDKCPKGYHVDHIIPLQGKLVSGLHVENNLQYLPAKDNLTKGNSFIIA